jgi:hypothetical protein
VLRVKGLGSVEPNLAEDESQAEWVEGIGQGGAQTVKE